MTGLRIKRAAVLGAGVMGAQIAAHLANAAVPVVLYDLPAQESDPYAIVKKAIAGLETLSPAPLAARSALTAIDFANYEQDLSRLSDCDLVIEAIVERLDGKRDLFAKIAPHLSATAILASNTSGLSLAALAEALPSALRSRFVGIHFFNPPRYMRLVELIAAPETQAELLDELETWLTMRLGKDVVRARDTPNFIANRIGVFSLLAAMHHTEAFGLGVDEVDALTGPQIGRPKSATYRTADVVGLDTLAHVVQTMREALPDDPWHAYFETPSWLEALIEKGALGQKTGAGFYRKVGKEIQVIDLKRQAYRPVAAGVGEEVVAILKLENPAQKFAQLRASPHPQARFLWAIFRDLFHYTAYHLATIADNARDVDLALRGGFGWRLGPFETWQAAGWQAIADAIASDIAAGKAMSTAPLPGWVSDGRSGVHTPQGSWSAQRQGYAPRSALPAYRRQLFPDRLVGEGGAHWNTTGETLFASEDVRLWRLPELDAGIGILSLLSKNHVLGVKALDGIQAAVRLAEEKLEGVVFWQPAPFAVGANLKELLAAIQAGQWELLEATVEKFQRTVQALQYAQVPVVAAVEGMALGGGCEFAMHCARRVMALESCLGLVETGVGLIPAGGGCKEFAVRAARLAARSTMVDEVFGFLQPVFETIAMAKVAKSALQAIDYGFAQPTDTVRLNAKEILYVAVKEARALVETGYAPPLPARDIPVAGRAGIANFELMLVNMKEGAMISTHDYRVARAVATALCGGEVEKGCRVDEEWLLAVERREFMRLLYMPETQARIACMLETGKPLRN